MDRLRLSFSNVAVTVALVAVGIVAYQSVSGQKKLHSEIDRLLFRNYLVWRDENENMFTLDVGVIQFLRTGYSVKLDSVSYLSDGAKLVGRIGNPKWINLSSLTLTFRIDKSYENERERFLRNTDWSKIEDSLRVASVQVSVGNLSGGSTVPFKVLLPNVKQSDQKYDFTVSFSGERYTYLFNMP